MTGEPSEVCMAGERVQVAAPRPNHFHQPFYLGDYQGMVAHKTCLLSRSGCCCIYAKVCSRSRDLANLTGVTGETIKFATNLNTWLSNDVDKSPVELPIEPLIKPPFKPPIKFLIRLSINAERIDRLINWTTR